ncbi:DUF397 domain-containing protein [Actinomadura sp. SCN-SB]|uniref:DUF397 domain-containing protein n=1 Tax=Actinomadura sp. SCN-SB TaxID=3373092 RepID=UPI0037509109
MEAGATGFRKWCKSSYTEGGTSSQCVELARLGAGIGVRDSKAPEAGHLTVSPEALGVLVGRVKVGEMGLT